MTNISVARASVFQKIDFAMDMTIVSISAMNSIVQVLTKYFSPYTKLLINNSHIIEAKILRNKLFIDFWFRVLLSHMVTWLIIIKNVRRVNLNATMGVVSLTRGAVMGMCKSIISH